MTGYPLHASTQPDVINFSYSFAARLHSLRHPLRPINMCALGVCLMLCSFLLFFCCLVPIKSNLTEATLFTQNVADRRATARTTETLSHAASSQKKLCCLVCYAVLVIVATALPWPMLPRNCTCSEPANSVGFCYKSKLHTANFRCRHFARCK